MAITILRIISGKLPGSPKQPTGNQRLAVFTMACVFGGGAYWTMSEPGAGFLAALLWFFGADMLLRSIGVVPWLLPNGLERLFFGLFGLFLLYAAFWFVTTVGSLVFAIFCLLNAVHLLVSVSFKLPI